MERYRLPRTSDWGREGSDSPLRKTDGANCTVRALMIALDTTYDYAHEILRVGGRKHGQGFPLTGYLMHRKVVGGCNLREIEFDCWTRGPKMTIRKFIEKHQKGRFICFRRGHAFAVVDGVIHDGTFNGPNQWIHHAYEVTEPNEGEF